ncbi:MAG: ABC transporter permease [Acidobacteriales bacterium]|nr:ABC transporter permease [Terriglobales bacterium]
MKLTAKIAAIILSIVFVGSVLAGVLAPAHYAKQFRSDPSASPSSKFLLGTDELGRDRFSRLLYGTRVSLLLAPAAALLSTVLAALIGGLAGNFGGRLERVAMLFTDLFMSMPWLFLLITVRAVLPLNTPPLTSVLITFSLLGLLGWAASARVVCSSVKNLRNSEFMLQAKAAGCHAWRLFAVHMLPNLKPILLAQFWISIPVFILAEANLGILGLGVSEPLPSWGSMLRELEDFSAVGLQPWRLGSLLLLLVVVSCFQLLISEREYSR